MADFVCRELGSHGLDVFMASGSLIVGEHWSDAIRANLRASNWVLFLASKAACASPWVQQELGMAIAQSKTLIPIVWDMEPHELPGWVAESQALNLRGAPIEQLREQMGAIAEQIKQQKRNGWLILTALVGGFLLFGSNES